jgi:Flp pilus assembly protein TadG
MGRVARILRSDKGAEIAEAAMVLPIVFMFVMGIVWFGRAFNIYSTITQAAERGAVTAARPACATCSAPTGGWNNFPGDDAVDNAVIAVLKASSIDPTQIIAPPAVTYPACPAPAPLGGCTTTNQITVCRSVVLNATTNPPQCGTVVSFQYPFKFYLPFTSLNMQQINLAAEAQSRMEN